MDLGVPARLDASAVIGLAEDASSSSVARWSFRLLQQAFPQADERQLLELPVGSRDRYVLMVRAQRISGPLRSEPVCGTCGATYELNLEPAAFGLAGASPWADPEPQAVEILGREVMLRPVNLGDVIAVEAIGDPTQAAVLLAGRAVGTDGTELPLEAVAGALEALDPAADVWIETCCPECEAVETFALDPVHFVAHEFRQLSQRILQDVVDIARAFHWTERDILALSEQRRAYYVAEALA
ncbi:MAG: hypothetical protein AAGE01_23915 [Pseudomonadota bacterium]